VTFGHGTTSCFCRRKGVAAVSAWPSVTGRRVPLVFGQASCFLGAIVSRPKVGRLCRVCNRVILNEGKDLGSTCRRDSSATPQIDNFAEVSAHPTGTGLRISLAFGQAKSCGTGALACANQKPPPHDGGGLGEVAASPADSLYPAPCPLYPPLVLHSLK